MKWDWTNNVGGGDFLVYYDGDGQYQPLAGMSGPAYRRAGPNLAAASYAGQDRRRQDRTFASTSPCPRPTT